MSNQFLYGGRNLILLIARRRLSSFNNNRARVGVTSVLNNEDLSIWSDQNWSEIAKQFNKSIEFPLPGRTGVLSLERESDKKIKLQQLTDAKLTGSAKSYLNENLDYLLNRPLPKENQINALKEAVYYQNKMDNSLSNLEKLRSKNCFELKAFSCPISLVEDFQYYFRLKSINDLPLTLITISFKTENDMATWNDEVEGEREALTKKFVESAQELCDHFEKEGFWADFIDPHCGRPYKSPFSHATFYETDERYRKLGFEVVDYGCCKVISHHKWGTKTYVGCMLTTATLNSKLVTELTEKFNASS